LVELAPEREDPRAGAFADAVIFDDARERGDGFVLVAMRQSYRAPPSPGAKSSACHQSHQ
jgi:hypothetical protein